MDNNGDSRRTPILHKQWSHYPVVTRTSGELVKLGGVVYQELEGSLILLSS